jgi:predicted ATP-binding protein involved in virulence
MTVVRTLAEALPNIQFILTSHSPLVVGSLEWMNILLMKPGTRQSSRVERVETAVHGLDADQVLLTDFFGLETTRASAKKRTIKKLALQARDGDLEAATKLLKEMSTGSEVVP